MDMNTGTDTDRIYDEELQLNAMVDRRRKVKQEMRDIERTVEEDVIEESEEGNKALSNAQKRKVEINNRLDAHDEYNNLKSELDRLERDIDNKNALVGLLKRQFWDTTSLRFSQVK